jgi:hypothetical protein
MSGLLVILRALSRLRFSFLRLLTCRPLALGNSSGTFGATLAKEKVDNNAHGCGIGAPQRSEGISVDKEHSNQAYNIENSKND